MYIGVYKLKTNCREKWTVFYLDLFRDRTHTYTESQNKNNKINLSIKKTNINMVSKKKGVIWCTK